MKTRADEETATEVRKRPKLIFVLNIKALPKRYLIAYYCDRNNVDNDSRAFVSQTTGRADIHLEGVGRWPFQIM